VKLNDRYTDKYAAYEAQFDPLQTDRQARRKRKPRAQHAPKKAQAQAAAVAEIAQPAGLEGGFVTTYTPSIFEAGWLLESLRDFFTQGYISDILAQVRGGKEASVYRCAGTAAAGAALVAAKVYRPRRFRQLRNDKLYREGRQVLDADGHIVKNNDHRTMRALGKKTAFGQQVAHTSWLMFEFTTMRQLYQAGAAVPRPIAAAANAILMGYCGDAETAAPMLNDVQLEPGAARRLFDVTVHNIELLLAHGVVHGDLSAYNILYWDGDITLIDFPQVVDVHGNRQARAILERDVRRVCEYFAAQGVERRPEGLTAYLWNRHVAPRERDDLADMSRLTEADPER